MENGFVFGVMRVFMFVTLPRAVGGARTKRVTLSTIACENCECKAKLAEFCEANPELTRGVRVHAEFTFTDLVH